MHRTKEEGEHRPVARGGQTGSTAAGEHAAQPAGVRQQRLLERQVDPVPVARGHEAHEVGACAGTDAVQVSFNARVYEYFILFYFFEITLRTDRPALRTPQAVVPAVEARSLPAQFTAGAWSARKRARTQRGRVRETHTKYTHAPE